MRIKWKIWWISFVKINGFLRYIDRVLKFLKVIGNMYPKFTGHWKYVMKKFTGYWKCVAKNLQAIENMFPYILHTIETINSKIYRPLKMPTLKLWQQYKTLANYPNLEQKSIPQRVIFLNCNRKFMFIWGLQRPTHPIRKWNVILIHNSPLNKTLQTFSSSNIKKFWHNQLIEQGCCDMDDLIKYLVLMSVLFSFPA